jgi:hypothetical protein
MANDRVVFFVWLWLKILWCTVNNFPVFPFNAQGELVLNWTDQTKVEFGFATTDTSTEIMAMAMFIILDVMQKMKLGVVGLRVRFDDQNVLQANHERFVGVCVGLLLKLTWLSTDW